MRAKFLTAPFFALGFLFQSADASVVQLPLNESVDLVSSGGALTVGIDDVQITGFPAFDRSNLGRFSFARAVIFANFNLVDLAGNSVNSGALGLEFDNCPDDICHHPPTPTQLTFLVPAGQFELDVSSSSDGASNSGSAILISYGIFASSDTIAAVPEPSVWAMLLLGFAGIGLASYRRSRPRILVAYRCLQPLSRRPTKGPGE
jgi:hypothetical protein